MAIPTLLDGEKNTTERYLNMKINNHTMNNNKTEVRKQHNCIRCFHSWFSRPEDKKEKPLSCPKCKSYSWELKK